MLHCTLPLVMRVLIFNFLHFRDGVSGIILTMDGENGSCESRSGLVMLPSKEVGRVVNMSEEDSDDSERTEHSEEERRISQAPLL